jgi:hypothetical protein
MKAVPYHALRWCTWRDVGGMKSKMTVRGTDNVQSEPADPDSCSRTHYRDIIH